MSWVQEQCALIQSLAGATIGRVIVVEMALADRGVDDLPVFRHPSLPLVQAHLIEMALADGRFAFFHNYQNDDTFGLAMDFRSSTSIEDHWNDAVRAGEPSINRIARDFDLPVGVIEDDVAVRVDNKGDITEVSLTIDGRQILLKAGEVYEGTDGRLSVTAQDESILVFTDPDAVAWVAFNPLGRRDG